MIESRVCQVQSFVRIISEFSTFHFPSSRIEPEEEEIELDDSLVVLDKCK